MSNEEVIASLAEQIGAESYEAILDVHSRGYVEPINWTAIRYACSKHLGDFRVVAAGVGFLRRENCERLVSHQRMPGELEPLDEYLSPNRQDCTAAFALYRLLMAR